MPQISRPNHDCKNTDNEAGVNSHFYFEFLKFMVIFISVSYKYCMLLQLYYNAIDVGLKLREALRDFHFVAF